MNAQNSPGQPGAGTTGSSGGPESSGSLAETKTAITQAARDTASKLKSAVSDTATRARDEAGRLASEKKETAANHISDYSSAIHDSARSLEEKDPNLAWFTHRAADRLQGAAEYMRTRDLSRLRQDAEDVARRHPAVFFGGMFLAGLILGNVVKASRRKADDRRFSEETADDSRWSTTSDDSADSPPELTEGARSAAGI